MGPDSVVIVFGPLGSGKTRFGAQLLEYFRAGRLVDDWNGRSKLQPGDLALTNHEPPFPAKGALVLDIATALRRCRGDRSRA